MKKVIIRITALMIALAFATPVELLAQDEKGDNDGKDKKETQQIIITRKNTKDDKVVVEIKGDKITINGKPLDEYKDKDGDINVRINNLRNLELMGRISGMNNMRGFDAFEGNDNLKYFNADANHAMLGVTTETADEGAEINSVTKESAAEKIGLKEGDIITKVDDKKIENPDDLSAAIKAHKPGDKVEITYLRDKKIQKATAELTKWKGVNLFGTTTPGFKFYNDMEGFDLNKEKFRELTIPRAPNAFGPGWSWSGNGPKLGLSVQDTDDGKGVKVIEVDEESNAAKAGIKEDDIVTEVDGKAVNSTDEMVKVIRESKEKTSVMIKLQRAGKTQNIEVKMPRKIKTADL